MVTLTNRGLAAANNVRAQLVTLQGSTPPAWARLVSSGDIGSLDIGQSVSLQIMVQPGAAIADGYYQYQLRLSADNDNGASVPVTVSVAQSGQGGVRFKLVDIYTSTLDAQGQPIPGLAGATIKLQNEALAADIRTLATNDQGLAEAADLPPGNYRWRASAAQHVDASGRIQVHAGLTASERVFLDNELISIEFSVTETNIRDEYQLSLEATYQTQVPAPVVLIEPLSIKLPNMQVSEEITGEITLSNYGLVRADNLKFSLPPNNTGYRYEFFGDMPTELAAKSRVVIPYRITALASLEKQMVNTVMSSAAQPWTFGGYSSGLVAIREFVADSNNSDGRQSKALRTGKAGGCSGYVITSTCVGYNFECASGDQRNGHACTHIYTFRVNECTSGGASNRPGGWNSGDDASSSTAARAAPSPIPLTPACMPGCKCAGSPGEGTGGGDSAPSCGAAGFGAGGGTGASPPAF